MMVNFLAVLVSAILSMVVGSIWYSPFLFAKAWMKATGKTQMGMKGVSKLKLYGVPFAAGIIFSYVLGVLVHGATLQQGLWYAVWVWLGFFMMTTVSDYTFAGRSWKLYCINGGYQLAVFLVSATVLTLWR